MKDIHNIKTFEQIRTETLIEIRDILQLILEAINAISSER